MLPKVAIICANYNYGHFILDGMESIINQTYEGEIRLYVVDDGSSDESWEIISRYATSKDNVFVQRIENRRESNRKEIGNHSTCVNSKKSVGSSSK